MYRLGDHRLYCCSCTCWVATWCQPWHPTGASPPSRSHPPVTAAAAIRAALVAVMPCCMSSRVRLLMLLIFPVNASVSAASAATLGLLASASRAALALAFFWARDCLGASSACMAAPPQGLRHHCRAPDRPQPKTVQAKQVVCVEIQTAGRRAARSCPLHPRLWCSTPWGGLLQGQGRPALHHSRLLIDTTVYPGLPAHTQCRYVATPNSSQHPGQLTAGAPSTSAALAAAAAFFFSFSLWNQVRAGRL